MEKGVISNSQFTILVIMFLLGSSSLIAPPLMIQEAKQDAWMSALIAIGFGLMFALLYGRLALCYPKLNLAEKCERLLGKWPGKLTALAYAFYFLLLTAALVRITGDFITTVIMPETPIQAIEIALLVSVIFGVRLGLEVFARTAEILIPWVVLFFFILVLALIPKIHLERLAPVMENGISQVLYGAYPLLGIPYLDMIIFLMITPYVTEIKKTGRNLMTAVIVGGTILTMNGILSITVLGPDFTARLNYPLFELTQKIEIGRFIQRIEVLAGAIMFISIYNKIMICFYSAVLCTSRIVGSVRYQTYTLPLGMFIVGLSLLISPNIVYFQRFALESWSPLCLVFGLVLPFILLFAGKLRKSQA